jgi:Fur family ferric uptake transcriptional regulator
MVELEHTDAGRSMPPGSSARAVGGRVTVRRAEVQRALVHSDGFVSVQVLHAAMVAAGSRVGLTTVYRTLAALAEAGHADTVRRPHGERLHRHRPGKEHRHYLICRSCGRSEPVETALVEDWARRLTTDTGYADLHHTLELSGICLACRAAAR